MGKHTRLALVSRLGRLKPHTPPAPRRRRRILLRVFLLLLALAFPSALLLVGIGWLRVRASLATLEGERTVPGIKDEVRIERDARGVPTLRARSRADLAFATGFVHAQDRFFQMDVLRRHAAGELAGLAGKAFLEEDRKARVHRFRALARRMVAGLAGPDREVLRAYARGVGEGLGSLGAPPWEYVVLGDRPAPWAEEDSILVALAMFEVLQGGCVERERTNALLYDLLPRQLADFLNPPGSVWDAPLEGGPLSAPPIPGPEVLDLRKRPPRFGPPPTADPSALGDFERPCVGSNNWAVSGKHTAHGGAILANDMHLWLGAPGLWYRASFVWPAGPGKEHHVTGATLPGTPAMVVGSNTHVAWGFTNTEGDWADLVLLEPDPKDPERYLTPEGPRRLEHHAEVIKVRGGRDVVLDVEWTVWGPVLDTDHRGRRRALRWVAHDPEAINLNLLRLETAHTLDEALAIAPLAGAPAQNFVVADDRGGIAWTILGRIPRRVGFDGRTPTSRADGKRRWDGWLGPGEYPRVVNPPGGRIWTANNRVVGEPHASRIGRNHYDLGARAGQIRDDLLAGDKFCETDMLAIQLDDRALFLTRWQKLLLGLLSGSDDPQRRAMRREVAAWGGRASVDSIGFRLVRRFRLGVLARVLTALTEPCRKQARGPRFSIYGLDPNVEESVWQVVTRRPAHLLPPPYGTWKDLLLDCVEAVRRDVQGRNRSFEVALSRYTWGAVNRPRIGHLFGSASSLLRDLLELDMPREPLPGDSHNMPRVQSPTFGASQRLAVSPGREGEGYFHMPAGQSGHPLSPHYRDGHEAWAKGRPTPFLPGPTVHALVLKPG
jgi:penicillin G amidase